MDQTLTPFPSSPSHGSLNPDAPDFPARVLPEPEALRGLLTTMGFPAGWVERLMVTHNETSRSGEAWAAWQEELDRLIGGESGNTRPTRGLDWQVLALALRMNGLAKGHAARGIDPEVSAATLFDLVRRTGPPDEATVPGRVLPLSWLGNHLNRNLLEIGCLQFAPGPFGGPFRVFRRTDAPHDPLALAVADIPCDQEGWPTEKDPSFVTAFCEDSEACTGHPLRPETGAISAEPVALPARAWEPILSPGDFVLRVHIPKGSVLSQDACRDAFRRAEEIYKKAFPEIPWRAFYCATWMLDPALDHLLGPESRIRAFAGQFRRTTVRHPNGRQIIERVLGHPPSSSTTGPMTSLQRKVREHLAAGGVFRTTGGYRLPR